MKSLSGSERAPVGIVTDEYDRRLAYSYEDSNSYCYRAGNRWMQR
jgi:hypothetical protein